MSFTVLRAGGNTHKEAEKQVQIAIDDASLINTAHEPSANARSSVQSKDLAIVKVLGKDGDANPDKLNVETIDDTDGALGGLRVGC